MKREKKGTPLLLKIIVPMIALSVLQILIIVTVMILNGEFSLIKRFSYNSLSEKTENRGGYVENILNRKTTLVQEAAGEVNAAVERLLAEEGLSADAITRDKELNKRILSESTEILISLIRLDMVNDAFLFLNSGDLYGAENVSGIYLRDTDVNSQSAGSNSDIYMETGSSEIARAFGMPLDHSWTLYWDITKRENERNRFYFETIESVGKYPDVAAEKLGSWSGFAGVANSSSESMKYTLPLVSGDGTVYGVIGIGLLKKTVLQSIPSSDFFDESACYILAVDPEGDGEYREMLSSGPAYSRLVDGETALNKSRPLEYGMYDFTSNGADCIGSIRDLRLYASDSPYRTQKWALISVADEEKTLEIHYMLIRVFLVTLAASLAAGILFALLVSGSISSPVTKMMRELESGRRTNTLVAFSSSGISEIDNLADSITELQSEALEYGSRVSRIITMAGGGIGVFLYDLRHRSVFLGDGLSELLGLSDFPAGEATVSSEEFRERIGQIDPENRLFGLKVFSEAEHDEDGSPKGEIKETAETLELSRVDPETGETVWLEFRVNRDGSQIVGLVQDITGVVTEKKRIAQGKDDEYTDKLIKANAALRDAYAVAKRANHAKTDFLSRMSHDIRTPMNAIIGMTAIAQMRLDDKERLADCLGKIEGSSRYLLSLINEVLDMSKIESGKFVLNEEQFKISELVTATVEMIRPSANAKKHEFLTDAAEIGHGCVIGDHVRIRQALVNILSNAVKYTPEGGKIEFTVTEKPTPESGVGCYEFIVRDNGIGMTKEFLDRLYEPFERASDVRVNKEQGTGLGMPITKNIIEMMNGEIVVESEPGKGTVFTVKVRLKLWEEAAARVSEEKPTSAALGTLRESNFSGIRALLVDDNALNLEIAEEILKMTGLEIETACDGKEAFERFSASPEGYYKIVFMDIQMPEMNGYEATAAIRSLNRGDAKTIPIVAMTANAFAEDVRAAKEAGMDEHIAKPLDFGRLKEVLNTRLGG